MDQFRQIGEVLGGMKALMVLQNDIQINQRQCCLIFDVFTSAFESIAEMILQNLLLEEKNSTWKPLEQPLKELHKIFKESEHYIQNCLEIKDWWGKAILLHQNKDCIEFHIHNLLSCFPVVIEAIEMASESSEFMVMRKYDFAWNDQRLFSWKFGKQYLVSRDICNRMDNAWKQDIWFFLDAIKEKKSSAFNHFAKNEQKLGEFLAKKLSGWEEKEKVKLLPNSILLGAKDYCVKRKLGSTGSSYKEIKWLGGSFAVRTFFGEIDEHMNDEISLALSISHPNILQLLCGFYDEQRNEGFLVMELMQKSLFTCIKENSKMRKRVPFTVPVAVDIMLQIARGMEHLHSRKIYHGELNPKNVLLKPRIQSQKSTDGYFQAKVKGFCLNSLKSFRRSESPSQNETNAFIWYAPEVLAEQEQYTHKRSSKYTEKADVYSFAMLCFELLTGKLPFEDYHLQGDKMVRNIRAGERPLFPAEFPKFLANLTRKCWQNNPFLRPSFSSICRILRYIKKVLIVDPDHGQPQHPPPLVDYCDLETGYSKKFPEDGSFDLAPVNQIPFQMFSYRIIEKAKTSQHNFKHKNLDSSHNMSLFDDPFNLIDDLFPESGDCTSVCSEIIETKGSLMAFSDQRSVFSEAPQRKNFLVDQASNYSESPLWKFNSSVSGNRQEKIPLKRAQTLPNSANDLKSICYEIPEEKGCTDSSNTTSPSSLINQEMEPKSQFKKTKEESQSPMVEQKPQYPETSEAESSHGLKITEKRSQSTERSKENSTISKFVENEDGSSVKVCPKIPEKKKHVLKKSIKDIKASTGSQKQQSPSASPARSFKGNNNSPGASPARSFSLYASPRASPLNPGARYTYKTTKNTENLLASGLNPSRRPNGR